MSNFLEFHHRTPIPRRGTSPSSLGRWPNLAHSSIYTLVWVRRIVYVYTEVLANARLYEEPPPAIYSFKGLEAFVVTL